MGNGGSEMVKIGVSERHDFGCARLCFAHLLAGRAASLSDKKQQCRCRVLDLLGVGRLDLMLSGMPENNVWQAEC